MKDNKTNIHILISGILLLLFNSAYSQENYLPGYVISPEGDTLQGFIDYQNWNSNPDKIFFKKQLLNDKIKYTHINIKGFGVSNEIYEQAIVQIEQSKDFTDDMDNNPDLILVTDTVFLQLMIQGTKSLYCYLNKSIKNQYYIKLGSGFQLLY